LPILGDQYGTVLERGELTLELTAGVLTVRYSGTVLPVAPHAYARVLTHRIDELRTAPGPQHPGVQEIEAGAAGPAAPRPRPEADVEPTAARDRDKTHWLDRLAVLLHQSAEVRDFVEGNVRAFNGAVTDPRSFDLLDGLLGDQFYRLAFWQVAAEEI